MFPRIARVMVASGVGFFFAANSLIHLRDQSQQAEVDRKVQIPQIPNMKAQEPGRSASSDGQNRESDRTEEADSMEKTR